MCRRLDFPPIGTPVLQPYHAACISHSTCEMDCCARSHRRASAAPPASPVHHVVCLKLQTSTKQSVLDTPQTSPSRTPDPHEAYRASICAPCVPSARQIKRSMLHITLHLGLLSHYQAPLGTESSLIRRSIGLDSKSSTKNPHGALVLSKHNCQVCRYTSEHDVAELNFKHGFTMLSAIMSSEQVTAVAAHIDKK